MPEAYSLKNKKIWVAGHTGLVGSSLFRRLEGEPCEVLTVSKNALDCRDQKAVRDWMAANKPDAIIIAAAKVGGIAANINAPAEFLYDNLMIEANIIHNAYEVGVEKLLFLGSSCMYPKDAPNPLKPEYLMSGAFEPTNAPYALAKMAGLELCRTYRTQYGCDFISAIPCNLYGPGDNFEPGTAHVIPALMMRMLKAKERGDQEFEVWGSGKPLREFLYATDLADALVFLLVNYSGEEPVNIGSAEEISIADLAVLIAQITNFSGKLVFNTGKPDGIGRKCMDSTKVTAMGWSPKTPLEIGLIHTLDSILGKC